MSNGKIKFVVVANNIFGYILPQTPASVQILQTSVVRGASVSWMNGSYPLAILPPSEGGYIPPLKLDGSQPIPYNPKFVRPATRQDFIDFRVDITPYEKDAV
jgi:hypothetical protein